MNRVQVAIEKVRTKAATLMPEQIAKLDADMALEFLEHHAYQNKQAEAFASGKLTLEEAQIIYNALGEVGSVDNGGWSKGTDTATKVVVTKLIGELMGVRA